MPEARWALQLPYQSLLEVVLEHPAVAQEVLGTQAVDLARAVAEVAQTMQAQEVEAATVAALAQVEAAARLALTELATQEQAATAHPATL